MVGFCKVREAKLTSPAGTGLSTIRRSKRLGFGYDPAGKGKGDQCRRCCVVSQPGKTTGLVLREGERNNKGGLLKKHRVILDGYVF